MPLQLPAFHTLGDVHGARPPARSAHCVVNRWPASVASPRGLLLFGGDTDTPCCRLNDLWFLNLDRVAKQGYPTWEPVSTSGQAPLARSNCVVVVAGSRLVVFGGWDTSGTRALADVACLDLETLTWEDRGCPGGQGPGPRGQPGAVVTSDGRQLVTFGGWDGRQRYNDLHALDLQSWSWAALEPQYELRPRERADHSAVLWRYCDDGVWKDLLVAFGGAGAAGPLADTWLFDMRHQRWTQAFCSGSAPAPRSSHAACIVGDLMAIVGGQARMHVFADCHLLKLGTLTWVAVECPGTAPPPPMPAIAPPESSGQLQPASPPQPVPATSQPPEGGLGPERGDWPVSHSSDGYVGSQSAAEVLGSDERRSTNASGAAAGVPLRDSSSLEMAAGAAHHAPQAGMANAEASSPSHNAGSAEAVRDALSPGMATISLAEAGTGSPQLGSAALGWQPGLPQLCRSAVAFSDGIVWGFGGFDGRACSNETYALHLGSAIGALGGNKARDGKSKEPLTTAEDLWRLKEGPLSLDDLPDAEELRKLPRYRQWRRLHEVAVSLGKDTYIDPATGYTVFTRLFLERRPCCGNKCRHCPHGFVNVVKRVPDVEDLSSVE